MRLLSNSPRSMKRLATTLFYFSLVVKGLVHFTLPMISRQRASLVRTVVGGTLGLATTVSGSINQAAVHALQDLSMSPGICCTTLKKGYSDLCLKGMLSVSHLVCLICWVRFLKIACTKLGIQLKYPAGLRPLDQTYAPTVEIVPLDKPPSLISGLVESALLEGGEHTKKSNEVRCNIKADNKRI